MFGNIQRKPSVFPPVLEDEASCYHGFSSNPHRTLLWGSLAPRLKWASSDVCPTGAALLKTLYVATYFVTTWQESDARRLKFWGFPGCAKAHPAHKASLVQERVSETQRCWAQLVPRPHQMSSTRLGRVTARGPELHSNTAVQYFLPAFCN